MRLQAILVLVAVGIMLAAGQYASAEPTQQAHWASFRNGGSSHASGDYPVSWGPKSGVIWQQELKGYGQSTPVIFGQKVFVASVIGPMKETCCVSCWNLKDGKPLWTHTLPAATKAASNYSVARAAPTPVVDASSVFVFFEGGDLVALTHDGEKQWHRNLSADFGPFENHHGLGSSPTQTDDLVIVTLEHRGPSNLVAVDKSSGDIRWKVDRPSGMSWTSPIVADTPAGSRVIVSSAGKVTAYDAGSGRAVWSMEGLEGNSVPSPTLVGNHLLIGARSAEFGDGSAAAKSNLCLKLSDDSYDVLWHAEKVLSDYSSPVVARDCVYYLNKLGVLTCLDLTSGARHYTERLGCVCWATPLVAGGNVYFFGKNGETHVVRAGATFERVAVNQLWNPNNPPNPETYVESARRERGANDQGAPKKTTGKPAESSESTQQRPSGFLGILLSMDKNGDGVLTKGELSPRYQRMLVGGDLNGDDKLDKAELKTMAESFRKRRSGSREGARDPIVYGVGAAYGVIVVRTGTRLYAIKTAQNDTVDQRGAP